MPWFRAILITVAFCTCDGSVSWAQTQNVQVPTDQRILTTVLSKYNELHDDAPNSIQQDKIDAQFRQEFCARIPRGDVTGWIGEVGSVDDRTPDKSIRLDLGVETIDIRSGALGVELSLGNYYAYGVDGDNTEPHQPTTIPVGSPLYDTAADLRSGDVVKFDGTFIPYTSPQACYDNDTTYFALVRFNSIQRLGSNMQLQ